MIDKYLDASKSKSDPPWDDLRIRRTWDRLELALSEPAPIKTEPKTAKWNKAWLWAPGVAVAAALFAAFFLFGSSGSSPLHLFSTPPQGGQLALKRSPSLTVVKKATGPSVITLADGSKVTTAPAARVNVLTSSPTRVTLRQTKGEVSYSVTKNPKRVFVVKAHGVTVQVLGTEFTVSVKKDHVVVTVTRGRVKASDSHRQVILLGGESVTLRGNLKTPLTPTAPATVPSTKLQPRNAQRAMSHAMKKKNASGPPSSQKPATSALSTRQLLAKVDEARRAGQFQQALKLLRKATKTPSSDPNQTTAYFLLAKMELALGNCSASARAFKTYTQRAPRGTFSMDALAGEAKARSRCGQKSRAAALAKKYLKLYPGSLHAKKMKGLLKE